MNESISQVISEASSDTLVLINGTIVSTEGFESYNSYVCFYIESNKNWISVNDSPIYGTTQKCRTNDSDLSLFSTPFQILLKSKTTNDLLELGPTLYLKVLSFNYRNVLVSESYGLLEIPIRRGKHSLVVNTWKPFIDNRLERMKQFFIGCAPNIHNFHYDSTQLNNSKFVNNYGLHSESSGSVVIQFDLIIQNEKPLINRDKYKVKTSSVNSIKQNILSVVLAFQRAKKRMDSIRNDLNRNQLF